MRYIRYISISVYIRDIRDQYVSGISMIYVIYVGMYQYISISVYISIYIGGVMDWYVLVCMY